MRDQATNRKFSEPTLVSITPAEAPARPKVLRRPAQFSASTAIAPLATPPAAVSLHPLAEPYDAPPQSNWQDDGRFAIMLLAIVIFINVAVVAWLGMITPDAPKPVTTVQQQPSAVPTIPKQRAVSVFSQGHSEEDYERSLPPLNSNVDVHVLDSRALPVSQ